MAANGGDGGLAGQVQEIPEEKVNWFSSPFYIGNFFTKLPDNEYARCNSCPPDSAPLKIKDGNTTGLASHLSRKHEKVFGEEIRG